jgi:valyl-tRNA synthetase
LQSETSSEAAQRGTRRTLVEILEGLLRLLHPIMALVTEEIWQQVAPRAGIEAPTIMLQPYPQPAAGETDDKAVADIEWLKKFILGVRQIREADVRRANEHGSLLHRVGRVESVTLLGEGEEPPAAATALLDELRLLVPMKGMIDVDAERKRLGKQLEKVQTDLDRARSKLDNPNFVNNAPADVVTQEKQRAADFERQIAQFSEQLEKLDDLG